MAMSYLPPMRFASWNTELTVGVSLTSIPFFANSHFSCATQTGQLKPPGNTMSSTGLGGAGCAIAQEAISSAVSPDMTLREIPFMLSSIDGFFTQDRRRSDNPTACGCGHPTVFSGAFLIPSRLSRNSGIYGREPHMQNDS